VVVVVVVGVVVVVVRQELDKGENMHRLSWSFR